MAHVSLVVGTRPQYIKLASLIRAFNKLGIEYDIIHTGQHYDYEMDKIFFEELEIPNPTIHLGVGSGSHGEQTAKILTRIEKAYKDLNVKLAIIPGDTNSALASGLASVKLGIHVAHVEAGLRSRLTFMAEEVNRIVLDHISSLLFAPTIYAYMNLLKEGIDFSRIFLVGDVMYDNIILFRNRIESAEIPSCIDTDEYIYMTCHRAENVDYPERLSSIIKAAEIITNKLGYKIVFPVHPRTRVKLLNYNLLDKLLNNKNICVLKPVGYLVSLKLIKNALVTLTDSGGVQKESFILGTPIVTLRETTEWVETVEYGWNILTGHHTGKIVESVKYFIENKPKPVNVSKFYGDGKASYKIGEIVKKFI